MTSTTITFRVDAAEHRELVTRAERDRVSLSDYIRVRLGLRGQGSEGDADIQIDAQDETLREQLADHERRLHALEDDAARRRASHAAP
jgi:50S ribosomal subunit-associated GTPase HflX